MASFCVRSTESNTCSQTRDECTNNQSCQPKYPPGVYNNVPGCVVPVGDYKKYFDQSYVSQNRETGTTNANLPVGQASFGNVPSSSGNSNSCSVGAQTYSVVVNPVLNLKTTSGNPYGVTFQLRRRNKTITAQWEGFSCSVGANGLRYVTINNTIQNAPMHDVTFPISLSYNGQGKIGLFKIVVNSPEMFRLYFDHTSNLVSSVNDTLEIYGGSVTWIAAN